MILYVEKCDATRVPDATWMNPGQCVNTHEYSMEYEDRGQKSGDYRVWRPYQAL